MSRDIDFTISNYENFKKILRPQNKKQIKLEPKQQQTKSKSTSQFEIIKQFIPQEKSKISQALRPELLQLKTFLKKKTERQKKQKQLIAEGILLRQQLKEQQKNGDVKDNVTIDKQGRAVDQYGNIVFKQNKATQLKINQNKQHEKQLKQSKRQKIKFHQRLGRQFFDRNLTPGKSKRMKKNRYGLEFLEKGTYKTVEMQAEQQNDIELQDVYKVPKTKIIKKRAKHSIVVRKQTPKIEWWDKQLILNEQYPSIQQLTQLQTKSQNTNASKILNFINLEKLQNPITYQKVGKQQQDDDDRAMMPTYLTKDQRKKLKRKRKKQQLQIKNDQIKLGLIKPEKPRLKISNMAVVLKDQFVLDPSRVQALTKKQVEQRLNKHLQSNKSRKLSKLKRKEKVIRKLKRDSAKQCRRAIFKLNWLKDGKQIFKINMNAQQLALNGMVIKPREDVYSNQPVAIVIQGGAKAVSFYKKLMLNRINWDQQGKLKGNKCKLIWQGQVQNTTLGKWKVHQVSDEVQTTRVLSEKGLGHYWDYIKG